VHSKLLPAFEELFDEVEEHALSILLEPWTLLINGDKDAFQQVNTVQLESNFPSVSFASFMVLMITEHVLQEDKHSSFDKQESTKNVYVYK